jgi:hypothetical protein
MYIKLHRLSNLSFPAVWSARSRLKRAIALACSGK